MVRRLLGRFSYFTRGRPFVLIALLLGAAPTGGVEAASPPPKETELYALRYGVSADMHWLFYLLRREDRVILVDCGFDDPDRALSYGVTLIPPARLVERLGIAPGEVTDILVTHAHFDHLGTIQAWPNARIWIHRDALASLLAAPFSADVAAYLKDNPRVNTFSGDGRPFPYVTLRYVGLHTRGSCVVRLDLPNRTVIIAGDEFYRRSEWASPPANMPPAKLALAREFQALDKQGVLILTMHDPGIAPRGAGAEGAVVRVYP